MGAVRADESRARRQDAAIDERAQVPICAFRVVLVPASQQPLQGLARDQTGAWSATPRGILIRFELDIGDRGALEQID